MLVFPIRKMATKCLLRAWISVRISENRTAGRGASIYGHPGGREAQNIPKLALDNFGKLKENPRIPETCWGDFRFTLGLPGPRGGRRWTRLVPQFDFLQLSSKSGLWEAISWPIFVFENAEFRLLKPFSPRPQKIY